MADTKVSALAATTDPLHSDLMYVVGNPGGTPVPRRATLRNVLKGYGQNILHYGALGNSNYSIGGGQDDSDFIEAWLADLKATGGASIGYVPGNRTFRFTRKITIPNGVTIQGLGGYDNAQETPPTFVWDGADGGIGFEFTTANQNVFATSVRNICVTSKASGNRLGTAFKFVTTGGAAGKLDSGTFFEDVWVLLTSSHAVEFVNNGATNFVWRGGRFDSIGGYALKMNLGGSGKQFIMRGENMTYQGGTAGQGMGFIFLDGETATANGDGLSFVTIDGLHTECNQDPDTTYSAGVRPYDKAGMIRLGVKPSLSTKQHDLQIRGWHHSFPGGIKSHSSVHITASSGSSVDAADKVSLNIRMAHTLSSTDTGDAGTTNEVRVLAGLVPSERMWPWVGCGNVAEYDPSVGPDNTSNGVRSFVYRRDGAEAHRSIGGIARTVSQLDAFPIGPCGPVLCTDCTTTTLGITPVGGGSHKMLVFYNGANWRTIAVAN